MFFYTRCKCQCNNIYDRCFIRDCDCECGGVDSDFDCFCEPILDSPVRDNKDEFDGIAGRVEERIDRIENIDDGSTNHFCINKKKFALNYI